MLQTAARRRRISGLWGSRVRGRSGVYPCLFSFAIVEFRPSVSIEEPCWTAGWTAGHLAWFLFGSRKWCSLRMSVQMPFGLCTSSSGGWCNRDRCCKIWGRPKLTNGWWSRTPSWNQLSLSTFWFTTRDISAQSICTLQGGLLSGRIFLKPAWSSAYFWSRTGCSLPYRIVENSLYNASNEQIGR